MIKNYTSNRSRAQQETMTTIRDKMNDSVNADGETTLGIGSTLKAAQAELKLKIEAAEAPGLSHSQREAAQEQIKAYRAQVRKQIKADFGPLLTVDDDLTAASFDAGEHRAGYTRRRGEFNERNGRYYRIYSTDGLSNAAGFGEGEAEHDTAEFDEVTDGPLPNMGIRVGGGTKIDHYKPDAKSGGYIRHDPPAEAAPPQETPPAAPAPAQAAKRGLRNRVRRTPAPAPPPAAEREVWTPAQGGYIFESPPDDPIK
jgi:hypothetical protein